jgi:CheY-like chemotaxis protein
MDMRMPVLDGYAAATRIKASPQGQATIVIAITASSFEEEREVILAAGCDAFLRKPFQEAELFALMHKHLGVRFVYEEEKNSEFGIRNSKFEEVLTPVVLEALPPEVLTDLEQAMAQINTDALGRLLDTIATRDAALAEALQQCLEHFEYTRILTLIQEARDQ